MILWAVIPSGFRRQELRDLVDTLVIDDVNVVIVDTGYGDDLAEFDDESRVTVLVDYDEPKNISRWWNDGLRLVGHLQMLVNSDYVVAVLNDDVQVPSGFVKKLADVIQDTGAAAAFPDQHDFLSQWVHPNQQLYVHRKPGPVSLYTRLCGYAFALRGSAGILADENLAWWYGDDDIDWRARQAGGSVLVGGLKVKHLHANSTTVGELAAQAGRDRQTFIDKWGQAPW